jgi:hypothetical protein
MCVRCINFELLSNIFQLVLILLRNSVERILLLHVKHVVKCIHAYLSINLTFGRKTTYSSGLVQSLQLINEEIKLCYGMRSEMM